MAQDPASPKLSKRFIQKAKIVDDAIVRLAFPIVSDLIEESRALRSVTAHVEFQKKLANASLRARQEDQELKRAQRKVRKQKRAAVAARELKRASELGESLDNIEIMLRANARVRYALRVVQDGVIWRLLGYRRDRIGVLGRGAPVNYLSASFQSECQAAEEHWEKGHVAVFCDLSNIGRTGDLIVLDPASSDIGLYEVKEAEDARDDTPQMRRNQDKVDFLTYGRSDRLEPDAPVYAAASMPQFRTHLPVLAQHLRRARKRGWSLAHVSDHANVFVTDARGIPDPFNRDDYERSRRAEHELDEKLGWHKSDLFDFHSWDRIERDEKNAFVGTAPFSIFPVDPTTAAGLALGIVSYRTVINYRTLAAEFEADGWRVVPKGEIPFDDKAFMVLQRPGGRLRVPTTIADQMLVELVSSAAVRAQLRENFNVVLDALEKKVHVNFGWDNEERVWK